MAQRRLPTTNQSDWSGILGNAMTPKNVAIEPELLERAERVAEAEGKTIDELATEALQRDLARRTFDRIKSEAEVRRRGLSDEDIETVVQNAIQESRAERSR